MFITTLMLSMITLTACQQGDPLRTGSDAPLLNEGLADENPAQPQVSEQYAVDPPVSSGMTEISEDGDIDPVLGVPVTAEFQEPVE